MKTIRVFLVDDHHVVCEGLRRMLELEHELSVVGEAQSGEEALTKLRQTPADVVLLDVRLGGIDGIETLHRLKELLPDVKILMLTSYGDEYLTPSLEAGATGYLLKRANREELVKAIHDALQGGRPIDSLVTTSLLNRMQSQRTSSGNLPSPREIQILQFIAAGWANKQIAQELCISEQTVKNHMGNVFDKLNANDRTHAVTIALRKGLITNPA